MRFIMLTFAFILAGCATSHGSVRAPEQQSQTIEIFAPVHEVITSAIAALDARRLGSSFVENTADGGAVVHGEQTLLGGAVFNSYGGDGKVAIAPAFPGSKRLLVKASTRSRLAGERPSAMDAIKGYNYSDPKIAIAIAQEIAEQFADRTTAALAAEDDAARKVYEAEVERTRQAAERERLERPRRLAAARDAAAWLCKGVLECDKTFALAQIYINQAADMKIQVSTPAIIETYTPTDAGKLGMKVVRMPLRGDEAEVRLTVNCRWTLDIAVDEIQPLYIECQNAEMRAYLGYIEFLKARLKP